MSSEALINVGLLFVATSLLWKGAEWTVVSACRVARRFNISDSLIGTTVIAFGTSAPEVVVTLIAALNGQPDISVGNVVGSNIFNLGFILGGCALFTAIPTTRSLVLRDTTALLCAATLLVFLLGDNLISRPQGALMMLLLAGYILFLTMRGEEASSEEDEFSLGPARARDFCLLAVGLASVIGGAHLLVSSASSVALRMGLSEWAVGVTIVAGGTSLPELATSIAAARRGRTSLIAGTLIGSDLFNLLGVLGLAAVLHPLAVDPIATPSVVMMTIMVAMVLVFMRTGWTLTRLEGLALVGLAIVRWSRDLAPQVWGLAPGLWY
ncbi:MAG: calcium/sodium antiporter [Myxococcota bacterium]